MYASGDWGVLAWGPPFGQTSSVCNRRAHQIPKAHKVGERASAEFCHWSLAGYLFDCRDQGPVTE